MSGFISKFLAKIGLQRKKKETEKPPEKMKPSENYYIPEAAQVKEPAHHVKTPNHVKIPQHKERQIRVFISSTFRDMKDERDILIKKIFPQLCKLCEERAVTWTEVDLRWGITTEEAAEGKVLPLCLAEIHRCRPYFIGLLGERYGWVPDSIPADLLESQTWLKEHLQHSVTELEILHGVFSEKQMHGHAYFYFRDPKYLESVPDGRRQDFIPEGAEAEGKLVKLKQKIRGARDEKICELREGYANPEQLGEWILEDFTALIGRLYPKDKIPDPLDQEASRHEAYAQSRRLAFVGRSDLLRQMDDHVGTAGAKPLVLTGESGCGKSALLAEWVARWRMENPEDLIIQHYTGSTPESADWQGLVRRILGELKRAYAITDELPMQPDALRTAMQDWLVKAAGSLRVVIVLDALNQLSGGDASARQLGWLPFALPPNVQLIVSSLPGESLDALRKRGWKELAVPLFARDDIAPAAMAYFDIFSKKLPKEILAKIENTPAAANALYLRAVLDELRQFGIHEELEAKASGYLSAPDLQTLFDRILTRWHEDFGQDREHPDLVRRSLCLIACSRFGLSEAELLDLLGMKNADGKYEPLPRRPWTPFYLAAENALAQRAGLLTFGHDYLRSAVMRRYLADDAAALHFQLQLAGYFGSIPEPTDRKLDELPALLRDTGQWGSLKELLADLPTFERLRERRWIWELHGFWLAIGGRFDPVEVYRHALSEAEPTLSAERLPHYLSEVAYFHLDAGRYEGAEPLFRRALEGRERVLGKEHPDTLGSVNNLAVLLDSKGDYKGAEPLFRRVLEASERVLGKEHPNTLTSMNNLAELLRNKGDYKGAEPLFRRVLEGRERVFGKEHPDTLGSMNSLAKLLFSKGDYKGAELLFGGAVEASVRLLGKEHPDTLASVNNLAVLLTSEGDYEGAEPLFRRALEAYERALGKEHPFTLASVNNLAELLYSKGDYEGAEPLFRRALEAYERLLGKEHPDTLTTVNNLALLLESKGDYKGAEPLYDRVLEASERVLGKEHPDTMGSVNNLGALLYSKGDYEGAEPLFRRALEGRERLLGKEHPNTLTSVNNLALLLYSKGDYKSAEPLFCRALEGRERLLGKEHPDTLTSVNNLAALLYNKGDYEGAEPLFHRALEDICKVSHNMGRAHADLKIFVNNYADCLRKMGMNGVQVRQRLEAVLKPYGFTQVINIIDSVVQRTGFQMGEGDNAQVNVRDSVVQRSNFGEKIDENVQFTVYRPKIVHPQKWYPLLAFAHLSDRRSSAKYDEPDPIKEVQKQAEQILNEKIEEYQDIIQDSRQSIPHKRELTFVPDIPGIEFNPPRRSFLWEETVHREEFRLRALSEMDGHICRGCITVFLGSIILAEIGLSIHVDSRHIFRSQNTAMEIENALPYRKIFVSYSHKDLKIVEQIKQYALALGDEYLQDLTHLSAGEVWNEQLKQMINEANIFQLFWSTNSMYSRFVKYEWEYALSLGRPNFIRPVHWEVPLPNCPEKNLPPDELLRLHFQRICYNMELTTELVTSEQITPKIDESSINQIPGEERSHETPVSMTKKIKLKDEIERREIERDSIEAEQGIELLRKLKGIKREDAASYQEIEERKLKARSGATDEALISTVGKDGGSSPAISHLGELARMKAAKGLTHEQILALQVKESAAAAEALKAKSVEKTEQLYRERARAAEEEINKSRKESEEQEKFQRQLKEEEDRAKIFKKWTILASGTGAGRIASLYFTKMKNVAIGDRILLMNSNRADIINTLLELEKKAVTEEEKALIKQIHERNTLLFGGGGAGNVYKEGEENARKDFETKIRRPIEALKIGANDVILDIVALGGGTGNGSIPYIIHQMKHGTSASLQNHIHVALAILPYSTEPDQRQFNAICGLSRLLKFGDNSQQNADMVLMVDNSKIASDIEKSEGIEPTFSDINKRIIQAIDLLISPGSYTKGVVDIKDYIKFPSMMNMYHFTPCLSTDNDINLIRLDVALDAAVNNSFVKMDPKTAVIGYLIMSIPEKYLNKGDFTEDEVNNIFDKWKKDNIIG